MALHFIKERMIFIWNKSLYFRPLVLLARICSTVRMLYAKLLCFHPLGGKPLEPYVKTISSCLHEDFLLTWFRSSYTLVNERHHAHTRGDFVVAANICIADGAVKC